MNFDSYYASYKVYSLGPNRSLEKNSSKTRLTSGDKRFLLICSRIIECDKPHCTLCEVPKSFLTITVEVKRSTL